MNAAADRPLDPPVFLIGTGRCGSTLLLRMLACHPDLAWMSHYTARLPGGPAWARLHRLHDVPALTGLLARPPSRAVPQPTEHYAALEAMTDHLFTAPRPLAADEVTPEARARLRAWVRGHLDATGRERFLFKHTGFPRVAYLQRVFPEARFVHVVRDGRAVASSLCHVGWWSGEGHWGWDPLTDDELALYRESGCHELVLAALYWKTLMGHLDRAPSDAAPGHLVTLRYDQLVADPLAALRGLCDALDLSWDPRFVARVRSIPITSDDTGWRRRLTDEEQGLLERAIGPALRAHGFGDPP